MPAAKLAGVLMATIVAAVIAVGSGPGSPATSTSPKAVTCGVERWAVKTLQDPAGRALDLSTFKATTVSALRGKPVQRGFGGSRGSGVESIVYQVRARLVEAKVEADSDIRLVIKDLTSSETMIVEFPAVTCASGATIGAKRRMKNARNAFITACGLPSATSFATLQGTATIRGVGFFDYLHGQTGVAPNGIELHPVLAFSSANCHAVPTSGSPRIWFAPLPLGGPFNGSRDYFQLFDPRARWQSAAAHVSVFKIYPYFASAWAAPGELESMVTDLRRRGIALAVEDGPLEPVPECGPGEGFGGSGEATAVGNRIAAASGTVSFVAFDEPYYYGHVSDASGCHWSPQKIASEVAAYETTMRSFFPNVVFGDIEPVSADLQPAEIAHWLDAYRQVTGSPLAFFHADVQFEQPTWPELVKEVEDAAHARGVSFGVIYTGGAASSDVDWANVAESRFLTYEQMEGGHPDDAIFQSWYDHPDQVLPETMVGTFTWLINRYFAPRG